MQWQNYEDLIEEQQTIGWNHIQYGIFSIGWTQQQYECAFHFDAKQDSQWLHKLIQLTWDFARHGWNFQNNSKHPINITNNTAKADLFHQIKNMY
eukprot:8278812-Ditylum_brightwellii.AAC.1